MPLFLNESIARKRFKDLLGQANHLLITILVGLYAVEKELINKVPEELRAAWNPQNIQASAGRSRVMVLQMALVRATDALDAYISWIRREPSLIQDPNLRNKIDGHGNKVFCRFDEIRKDCSSLDKRIAALIAVMIVWRNLTVHSLANNPVPDGDWKILEENKTWLRKEFKGMEFERLLSNFNKGDNPTFKETASFIRATQCAIEHLDGYYLQRLDKEAYLKRLIWDCLSQDKNQHSPEASRKKNVQSIWGQDISVRENKVVAFLINNGLSDKAKYNVVAEFPESLINKIVSLNPKQLLEYLKPVDEPHS